MPSLTHVPANHVYLIGEEASTVAKIGRSKDVRARLSSIQNMSPARLHILDTTPGGAALEDALHEHFADIRIHGEWFNFGERDRVEAFRSAVTAITPTLAASERLLGHEPTVQLQVTAIPSAAERFELEVDGNIAKARDIPADVFQDQVANQAGCFARRVCPDLSALDSMRLEMVVNELVHNAKAHGARPVDFDLVITALLTVSITDHGANLPSLRKDGTGGLAVVVAPFSGQVNLTVHSDGSKTITAVLSRTGD